MDLKGERLKFGLTQQEVATFLNKSRVYYSYLENGKRKISPKDEEKLRGYFDSFVLESTLDAKIDYVTVSFKTVDVTAVIENVLMMDQKYFYYEERGIYGYKQMYSLDNIKVYRSDEGDNRGVLIDLRGRGCRNYDIILDTLGHSWKDFFNRVNDYQGNITRIDIALDDKEPIIELEELAKRVEKGFYWKKFKTNIINRESLVLFGNVEETCTLYFGSRQSNVHFCFYKKDIETMKREQKERDYVDVRNRYEIRLRNKKAMKFVSQYLASKEDLKLALNVIQQYLVFYEERLVNDELIVWDKWYKLIGEIEQVDLRLEPISPSLDRTLRWLENQVSAKLKLVKEIDKTNETNVLETIIENGELSERDETFYEIATTDVEEWVSPMLKKKVPKTNFFRHGEASFHSLGFVTIESQPTIDDYRKFQEVIEQTGNDQLEFTPRLPILYMKQVSHDRQLVVEGKEDSIGFYNYDVYEIRQTYKGQAFQVFKERCTYIQALNFCKKKCQLKSVSS